MFNHLVVVAFQSFSFQNVRSFPFVFLLLTSIFHLCSHAGCWSARPARHSNRALRRHSATHLGKSLGYNSQSSLVSVILCVFVFLTATKFWNSSTWVTLTNLVLSLLGSSFHQITLLVLVHGQMLRRHTLTFRCGVFYVWAGAWGSGCWNCWKAISALQPVAAPSGKMAMAISLFYLWV